MKSVVAAYSRELWTLRRVWQESVAGERSRALRKPRMVAEEAL
eukprot:CAMPEP_0118854582 /NCGR_PEP_ID=MMETSP1163-20130328/2739_1 /TAXON_ID=124430 /ORGANISM="Phaeomonas parva, Strain CCMP2877" /LENGTH=42 /DNA_ID= /DNA_START= /DNA_END= /DNA_ORIENTATION=